MARLTVFIAIYCTAEVGSPLPDGSVRQPKISLFPATALGLFIFVFHFLLIAWFKHRFVRNFSKADRVQQFVHVLVNTMVAVPFSNWDVDPPASLDEDPTCERAVFRTSSLPPAFPSGAGGDGEVSAEPKPGSNGAAGGHDSTKTPLISHTRSASCVVQSEEVRRRKDAAVAAAAAAGTPSKRQPCVTFPNVPEYAKPGVMDLRAKITEMWWDDPSRELTLSEVRERLGDTERKLDEETVATIFEDLSAGGFINKRGLYLPQKTKREYFWLFAFHLAFSLLALVIEVSLISDFLLGGWHGQSESTYVYFLLSWLRNITLPYMENPGLG